MHWLRRLRQAVVRPHPLAYAFGRFHFVRQVFSRLLQFRQLFTRRAAPSLFPMGAPASVFQGLDLNQALLQLRQEAVTPHFLLPANLCDEIRAFCLVEGCFAAGVPGEFAYRDVVAGRLPNGTAVATGHFRDPLRCSAVAKVSADLHLQSLVQRYLGYRIRGKSVLLWWSFASQLDDQTRRNLFQTIDYHFDVHAFNFCYLHVYLTDTDRQSGAHVMVRGSHRRKPFRWLLGSARRADSAIEAHYGTERVLTLEGPSGTAFLEDTACYHKALAPVWRDRLMLQIRYY